MGDKDTIPPAATEMMKTTPEKKQSMDPSGNESRTNIPPPPMRKLSRSQSITTSAIPTNFILPPDVEDQWRKRRESLDNLNLEKVAPWMHLHDFSESEQHAQEAGSANSA